MYFILKIAKICRFTSSSSESYTRWITKLLSLCSCCKNIDLFLLIVFTFIMTLVMVAILIKQWILFHLQEFTTPQ